MPGQTPRQRAREETLHRIKTLALQQLAESGAGELSLRAIARELNIVSSAIYRYYASRDELITALITDGYNDLADTMESVAAPNRRSALRRWRDVCHALRDWARAEPHRFGLIYGTTIPGYHAPQTTVEPAARCFRAFCLPGVGGNPDIGLVSGRRLRGQLDQVEGGLDLVGAGETVMFLLAAAFGRIIGMITLELGGHFVGAFEPADELYAAVVDREAELLGLATQAPAQSR